MGGSTYLEEENFRLREHNQNLIEESDSLRDRLHKMVQ